MQLTINGKAHESHAESLNTLITELKLDVAHMAVERNGHIIPRGQYSEVTLEDGDSIELVEFVGGG